MTRKLCSLCQLRSPRPKPGASIHLAPYWLLNSVVQGMDRLDYSTCLRCRRVSCVDGCKRGYPMEHARKPYCRTWARLNHICAQYRPCNWKYRFVRPCSKQLPLRQRVRNRPEELVHNIRTVLFCFDTRSPFTTFPGLRVYSRDLHGPWKPKTGSAGNNSTCTCQLRGMVSVCVPRYLATRNFHLGATRKCGGPFFVGKTRGFDRGRGRYPSGRSPSVFAA